MKKYKVQFSGFVYVEADSPEEALERTDYGDTAYEEKEFEAPEEIDDFVVEIGTEDII